MTDMACHICGLGPTAIIDRTKSFWELCGPVHLMLFGNAYFTSEGESTNPELLEAEIERRYSDAVNVLAARYGIGVIGGE